MQLIEENEEKQEYKKKTNINQQTDYQRKGKSKKKNNKIKYITIRREEKRYNI